VFAWLSVFAAAPRRKRDAGRRERAYRRGYELGRAKPGSHWPLPAFDDPALDAAFQLGIDDVQLGVRARG
jgi:hypothetical protein